MEVKLLVHLTDTLERLHWGGSGGGEAGRVGNTTEGGRELRSCAVVTKSAGKRILSPAAIGFKSESNSWPLPPLILKITNFLICAWLSAQWRQEPLMRWRTSASRCDWRVLNSELSAPSRSAPSSSSPRHGNGSVKRWLRAYVCGVHVCLCAQSKADA